MKIIEALKELPLIKKKMEKTTSQIREYSSYLVGVNLAFETEERQKQEVESLIQSNLDLATRFEKLTEALSRTNSSTIVEIEGVKKTIRGWITYRNVTANYAKQTYEALTNTAAQNAINANQGRLNLEAGVQVKRLYKEEEKLKQLNKIQSIVDKIDATLEIVNVNTDLVE